MKLSLMWLREHLEYPQGHASFLDHAEEIVRRLVRSTAEIEQVEHLSLDLSNLFLGRLKEVRNDDVLLHVPELSCDLALPGRSDSGSGLKEPWYMIYRESVNTYRYATMADITYRRTDSSRGSVASKDLLLPAFYVHEDEADGSWKKRCDLQDVRITVDNKSINHRPDLWSHYGFAREVSVMMGWGLRPLAIVHGATVEQASASYVVVQSAACDRFARLDTDATEKGSIPWMALRLSRVDHRPISTLVDTTNYVMFDMGQPLHAFDSDKIKSPLIIRQAHEGEKLTLLDTTTILLQNFDCVVADQSQALSLAGIKGGGASGVWPQTTKITLEAAHFSPIAIRRSSKHHHIRTESSTRFEKGLDATNVVLGIMRFVSLLLHEKLIEKQTYTIMLRDEVQHSDAPAIELTTVHLARKLGMELAEDEVGKILSSLGFVVSVKGEAEHRCYCVQVPSWRRGDVTIPEDLIEEIARIRGYDSLDPVLPQRLMQLPTHNKKVLRARAIRHHLAYGLRMQEVMSYPFFDEEFIQKSHLSVTKTATVRNPVSEQWRRLVTSLVPNLVAQVTQNLPEEKEVRLFEVAATWEHNGPIIDERRAITWVWYSHKELDFYSGKHMVTSLLEMLRIPHSWRAPSKELSSWWQPSHTAELCHAQKTIGYAGMLNPSFLTNVLDGHCFAAELDFDFLQHYSPEGSVYSPLSKYPTIATDISMLLSYATPVEDVMAAVRVVANHITHVSLVDFFEKKAWGDQRSVTIRIVCGDQSRTMTHEEVNEIIARVVTLLQKQYKAEIR